MDTTNWMSQPTLDEPMMKMPLAWSQLQCASCGRPVGAEAAGSMECLVCTVRS